MRHLASAFFLAIVVMAVCGIPTLAHHGNAAYDETRQVTLHGTVTEFDFVNPHVQIYFDAKNSNGNVVHWGCETLSPGKLTRAGWTRDVVKPGDRITITLFAAKDGAPVGLLQKLTFDETGKQLGTQEQP